jgi:hypothetical protein
LDASAAVHSGEAVVSVTLGKSVVALNGPWKFQIEDAPKRTRDSRVVMGWPGFDDFHWET